jgi:Arc/MetJ family transcription regulator
MAMIDVDADSLKALIAHLQADIPTVKKAVGRAMRDALRFGVTRIKKELKPILTPNLLKRRILSKFQKNQGTVFAGLNETPLEYFYPTLTPTKGGLMGGGDLYPDTFLVRGQAFYRKTTKRFPIARQMVGFIPEGERAAELAYNEVEAKFFERLEHHLYYVSGQE